MDYDTKNCSPNVKNATQDYRLLEQFLDNNNPVQLNQMILGREQGPEEMEYRKKSVLTERRGNKVAPSLKLWASIKESRLSLENSSGYLGSRDTRQGVSDKVIETEKFYRAK